MAKRPLQRIRESSDIDDLRARLKAAEDTLDAIRSGRIDALVVSGDEGDRVLTLSGTGNAYRVFVEAMEEGAATIAQDGTILYSNHCFARIVGDSPEGVVGRSILNFVTKEDQPTFEGLFRESLKDGSAKAELCIRRESGEDIPVLVSLKSLEKFGARALCMVVTDLTEQKRNEKLLAAGKLARHIVEQATEIIVVCDRQGRIIQASHALHEVCESNVLFQPFDEVLRLEIADMRDGHGRRPFSVDEVLQGKTFRGAEVCLYRENEEFAYLLNARPIRDTDEASGCVVTMFDIGERKRVEESLRHSERLAATGRLAASIAHEINNPLEGITNLLYLIETVPGLNATARQYAETAQKELARVAHITKQTLTFYRESSQPQPMNVKEMIEDLATLYASKLQHKRVVLRQQLDEVEIRGYRNEIMQVISNLLLNAVDAVPPQSEIWIRCYASHEWSNSRKPGVRIVIADRGPGISPENRAQLFEPFFTTKGEKGTGLGLWVSRGIVNRHQGFIRLRSSTSPRHNGSVFSIFLPAAPGDASHSNSRQSQLMAS
ncbi:MAG TPA: ATP-binding protein [Terriglobales bacterium]|nr:ATP-binding protein [Terriglobales bacterium]